MKLVGYSLALFMLIGGCTATQRAQVSHYQMGQQKLVATVPMTGVYNIRWLRPSAKNLHAIQGTVTLLRKGELVGFEPQDDGTIVAIAGETRFTVNQFPDDARMLLWYHKSKRQTQFGKEMAKATETAANIAVIGGTLAAGAALVGVGAYLDRRYGTDAYDSPEDR